MRLYAFTSKFGAAKHCYNRMNTTILPHEHELLTKEGVAEWLHVSTRTVESLMSDGRLPFVKLGHRTVRFRRADVQKLVQN